jgi:uncharacterized integral membrane protein (TIGR00698 family)
LTEPTDRLLATETAPPDRPLAWVGAVAPGFLLAVAIAAASRLVSPIVRPVPDVVLALAAGIVIRNSIRATSAEPGAKFVMHYVLRGAIVLIGASLTLQSVVARGWSALGLIAGLVTFAFALGLALSRLSRLSSTMGVLIGAGTAICGATAILVVSPIIRAKASETAYAVATIFTFNLLALVAYPIIGHWLNLGQTTFGTWVGTAVNDTSVVVATGFSYGQAAGAVATITKLTRTLLLLPLVVLIAVLYASRGDTGISRLDAVRRASPWFVFGFLGLAAFRTAGYIPTTLLSLLASGASFGIVIVLASVGLSVDLRSLTRIGYKAIAVGILLGTAMSVISLSAILTLHL